MGNRGRILGQVVHNERVVEEMEQLGVRTVQRSRRPAPDRHHRLLRARRAAVVPRRAPAQRGLSILDTTCPFVYDIHDEARGALAAGSAPGLHRRSEAPRGDRLHPRSRAGSLPRPDDGRRGGGDRLVALPDRCKIFYQTTLNADDFEDVARFIESRCPGARRADTICYATKENQDAARLLAADPEIGLILVIGGKRSANTRHLWEICAAHQTQPLIQGADDLDPEWFEGVSTVGITAGASTPDYVVDEVEAAVARLRPAPLTDTQRSGQNAPDSRSRGCIARAVRERQDRVVVLAEGQRLQSSRGGSADRRGRALRSSGAGSGFCRRAIPISKRSRRRVSRRAGASAACRSSELEQLGSPTRFTSPACWSRAAGPTAR